MVIKMVAVKWMIGFSVIINISARHGISFCNKQSCNQCCLFVKYICIMIPQPNIISTSPIIQIFINNCVLVIIQIFMIWFPDSVILICFHRKFINEIDSIRICLHHHFRCCIFANMQSVFFFINLFVF